MASGWLSLPEFSQSLGQHRVQAGILDLDIIRHSSGGAISGNSRSQRDHVLGIMLKHRRQQTRFLRLYKAVINHRYQVAGDIAFALIAEECSLPG